MQTTRLFTMAAVTMATAVGFCGEPVLRGEEYRKFVAELAHYPCQTVPDGFPQHFVDIFNGWMENIIRLEATPSHETPRLIHRSNGDTCDTVAALGTYDGRPMRLVQTFSFFVVAVDVGDRSFDSPEAAGEFVSQVARSVFTQGDRVRLKVDEGPEGRYRGRQDSVWDDPEDAWNKRTSFDTLEWWIDPGELLMVLIKTYPGYPRGTYMTAKYHRNWFNIHGNQP